MSSVSRLRVANWTHVGYPCFSRCDVSAIPFDEDLREADDVDAESSTQDEDAITVINDQSVLELEVGA
jgi:hypothetical protein